MAGSSVGDSFNPVGESTWYRLGGGLEARFEGFAFGFDAHWTVPGERQIERHLEENGEALLAEYVEGLGSSQEIPGDLSNLSAGDLNGISPGDALEVLELDRVEFTFGVRYYF